MLTAPLGGYYTADETLGSSSRGETFGQQGDFVTGPPSPAAALPPPSRLVAAPPLCHWSALPCVQPPSSRDWQFTAAAHTL